MAKNRYWFAMIEEVGGPKARVHLANYVAMQSLYRRALALGDPVGYPDGVINIRNELHGELGSVAGGRLSDMIDWLETQTAETVTRWLPTNNTGSLQGAIRFLGVLKDGCNSNPTWKLRLWG